MMESPSLDKTNQRRDPLWKSGSTKKSKLRDGGDTCWDVVVAIFPELRGRASQHVADQSCLPGVCCYQSKICCKTTVVQRLDGP